MAWDLSCKDWAQRLRDGRSLVPELPLFEDEATAAAHFYDALRLPDVPGTPELREAGGQWFRDIVRALFGSRDPATNERHIREVFALVGKGNSKTTNSAALMLTALLMNVRPRAEHLLIGPTQSIADLAFAQASGMVQLDRELKKRFRVRDHLKEIVDLLNGAKLKVKTFDLNILTGPRPVGVLLDEIHLLGPHPATAKVLRQLRGGLEKNTEGFLAIITTQSDEPPAGAFRDELNMARAVRDGRFQGRVLPVLYEFPDEIARSEAQWQKPSNWPMVMPNLGRSLRLDSLIQDFEAERAKGQHAIRVWASQHLNVEIGIGLKTDRWAGADHWEIRSDPTLTWDALLQRSECIVIGLDGGGLDDLFGFVALGREPGETIVTVQVNGQPRQVAVKRWLCWAHAWCHSGVLDLRKSIASRLEEFAAAGDLTIVEDLLSANFEIVGKVQEVLDAGLLGGVAADPAGPYGDLVDHLDAIGVTQENKLLTGVGQGYRLMNAIKTSERRLANGTLVHSGSTLMAWCVSNLKIEPTATAIRATKQNAGDAKIDPAMALFDAVETMTTNPEPQSGGLSIYDVLDDAESDVDSSRSGAKSPPDDADDRAILADRAHPGWQEARERFEAALAMADDEGDW